MKESDGFQQLNYSMQLSPMKRKNKKRSYSLLRTEESPNFPYFLFGLNKYFMECPLTILCFQRHKSSPLPEKCPNTKFFLVCISPHLEWIRRDTPYLSVFSPNAGKYGLEKTPYLPTFHAVHLFSRVSNPSSR